MPRGKDLERQLDKLCAYVNALGFHAHKNHPLRTADGAYIAGEPFDYEIFLLHGERPYHACFDAKECADTVWHMKPKDIKQAEALKHCKNAGLDAFFLVYFVPLRVLLKIDIDEVIAVLQTGHKSVPSTLGVKWDMQDMFRRLPRREMH